MNKVITINLGGTAWQLEEGGYDTLRLYLETAAARLQGNPDREEIISDIEWAIAEKFRGLLSNHKTVVLGKEVATVLAEMGPIEAEPGKAPTPGPIGPGAAGGASPANGPDPAKPGQASDAGGTPRQLYRIHEGAMVAGVCNGIAAYLNLDPTLVRLAFVFLTLAWGTGVIVYVVMAIVVPEAHTPAEKAAASGNPSTAQEFIHRAREGYYEAMKGFPDRQARREWKRRFKSEMRMRGAQWKYNWHSYWARHVPTHPAMGIAMPFITAITGMAGILWVCAFVSLLATGEIFGRTLPANVPVWVAAVLLFILYGLVAGPLKMARRVCYWGMGQPRPAWSVIFLMEAMIGVAVFGVLAWLAWHHLPELNEAVKTLPAQAHQAANDIETWWKGK